MLHIKKEDQVKVIAGRTAARPARSCASSPTSNRAVVENVNFVKRHTRPNPSRNIKGGVVEREAPIHLSNLMVICRECNKPTRVGFMPLADNKKVRVCKSCNGTIDK